MQSKMISTESKKNNGLIKLDEFNIKNLNFKEIKEQTKGTKDNQYKSIEGVITYNGKDCVLEIDEFQAISFPMKSVKDGNVLAYNGKVEEKPKPEIYIYNDESQPSMKKLFNIFEEIDKKLEQSDIKKSMFNKYYDSLKAKGNVKVDFNKWIDTMKYFPKYKITKDGDGEEKTIECLNGNVIPMNKVKIMLYLPILEDPQRKPGTDVKILVKYPENNSDEYDECIKVTNYIDLAKYLHKGSKMQMTLSLVKLRHYTTGIEKRYDYQLVCKNLIILQQKKQRSDKIPSEVLFGKKVKSKPLISDSTNIDNNIINDNKEVDLKDENDSKSNSGGDEISNNTHSETSDMSCNN